MDKILESVNYIRSKTDFVPKIALVLGSGLGKFVDYIQVVATIDYKDIDGFQKDCRAGRKGKLVFGYVENVPVVVMQGRYHYYEGFPMQDVVHPIRVLRLLGAEVLILTNSGGGISDLLKPGSLMLIRNHISLFVPSPLIGKNVDEIGPRFPDMTDIYDRQLQNAIRAAAYTNNIRIHEGIYVQTSGPNYESLAEVRMLSMLGADVVGMSTACEAIAGKHAGMRVCGISCISNMATGLAHFPLTHEEVVDIASKMAPKFASVIKTAIVNIDKECLTD